VVSRLIGKAVEGQPLVKVAPVDAADLGTTPRIGFPAGEMAVPDDFDRMGQEEIEALFGGKA
jgi:hypothetical protein